VERRGDPDDFAVERRGNPDDFAVERRGDPDDFAAFPTPSTSSLPICRLILKPRTNEEHPTMAVRPSDVGDPSLLS
jgi:hypothetical protein